MDTTNPTSPIVATIAERIRIPIAQLGAKMLGALKSEFTYPNPDFHKKRAMGYATFGVESTIKTFRLDADAGFIELPRGGTKRLRTVARIHGRAIHFIDRRVVRPEVTWPKVDNGFALRPYQRAALEACIAREQGIVRAPTGSGKTAIALALAAATRQPTLVIMRDTNLLKQWSDRAVSQLGISKREIGVLKGSTALRIGPRLTLALQQTLYSPKFPLASVANEFGAVIVDEVHTVAAATFQRVIDVFPARYRFGFSADETRRDKREFLVYDQLGEVVHEVEREELESDGTIHRVMVRLIPTDFDAEWYRAERNFGKLIDELTTDEARNEHLLDVVKMLVDRKECPVFVFTHRIEHARWLADVGVFSRGIPCGLMLGGSRNAMRFDDGKTRLAAGTLNVAAGTYQAIGQGLDVPRVEAGIMATPIGNNRQFFTQIRGRVCRTAEGKRAATLYLMWDRSVFPDAPKVYSGWNNGHVEVWDPDHEVWRPASGRR